MTKWREAARHNILSHSIESKDHLQAVSEWEFQGNVYISDDTNKQCELCLQKHIRYHYEITNRLNSNILKVGSSCILRFDVAIIDDLGHYLTDDKARKRHLNKKLKEFKSRIKLEYFLESLRNLFRAANDEHHIKIGEIAADYKFNKKIDPENFLISHSLFEMYNVEPNYSSIEISLKDYYETMYVVEMPPEDFQVISDFLTPEQRKSVKPLREKFIKEAVAWQKEESELEQRRLEAKKHKQFQEEQYEKLQQQKKVGVASLHKTTNSSTNVKQIATDSYHDHPSVAECSMCGVIKSWSTFTPKPTPHYTCGQCLAAKKKA